MTPPVTPGALAALHAAAMRDGRPWSAPEWASLLASPGALLLGDARAALLGRLAADEAEVLMLLTDPLHRRRGLARALLRAFLARAAARGATRAVLEVAEDNAPALALYGGAGFRPVGRRPRYYARAPGPSADALLLARPLP